ncbi:MAG: class I SAM-dependent methyltransferase [Candidatus Hermodarchaeota archaeon]
MNLSVAERQFLMTLELFEQNPTYSATGEKLPPNIETLRKHAAQIFKILFIEKLEESTFDKVTIDNLIDKGLLEQNEDIFTLTKSGLTSAKLARKSSLDKSYSDRLIRSCESKTYSIIREKVYGKNLCQLNMMTMSQLTILIDVLALSSDDTVLDLGCGIGKITECLSDLTKASIIGVDIASGAIESALDRTRGKRNRIEFRVDDMDDLSLPPSSVNCIIAIDTLYFVENLETTIKQMKLILKPNGRMGLFYSEICAPKGSKEILQPNKTKLAEALKKNELNFKTIEFTESEKKLWNRLKQLYEDLETDFQEEGNHDLWKKSYQETLSLVKAYEEGRCRRYLYNVKL